MATDSGIQNERLEIQNVLKSMSWEVRLEEARARRKEVLDRREREENRDKPAKARLPGLRVALNLPEAPADKIQEADRSGDVVRLPMPVAPRVAKIAPSATGIPPADVSVPEEIPAGRITGRLAMGFGIGLGLGLTVLVGWFLFGASFSPNIAKVPDQIAVSTSTVAMAPPAVEVAPSLPAVPATALETSTAVVAATARAPSVADSDPVAPSNVAFSESQTAVAARSLDDTVPNQKSATQIVSLAGDSAPAIPAQALKPEIGLMTSGIGPEVGSDNPAEIRLSASETLLQNSEMAVFAALPSPSGSDSIVAALAPPESPVVPVTGLALLAEPDVTAGVTAFTGSEAQTVSPQILPPDRLVEPGTDLVVSVFTGQIPASDRDNLSLPNAVLFSLHVHAPSKLDQAEVEAVLMALRLTGIPLSPITKVPYKVSKSQVRYYHTQDVEQAGAVAERIGAVARDFTDFRPSPADGWIEIYLAGEGVPAASKKVRRTTRTPAPPTAVDRLVNSLVQSLRRGDYLR